MRRSQIGFAVLVSVCLSLPILAQTCGTLAGRWPEKPYGTVRSSVIGGNYAYYGNGLVLTVLDISDPANPILVREIPLPSDVDEGEPLIESGYLFLPLSGQVAPSTLKIYDLADPENPSEIASLGGFEGLRGGLELYGGLLYATDDTAGLRVVSLSPITAPSIIGSYDTTTHARDVTVYEKVFTKYAYLLDSTDGIFVLNVTNPANPTLITSIPIGEWGESVARVGEHLFVTGAASGLRIFSLADPALPALVATYPSSDYTEWFTSAGDTAYVCDGYAGVEVLDISTPASPTLLGQFDTSGMAMHVVLNGSTALLADDFAGLRILDISNPAATAELAHRDLSEEASFGLWSDGNRALVTRWFEGLATFDVSDPAAPTELAVLGTLGLNIGRAVTVSGTSAYISNDRDGLSVVDISNPSAPSELGTRNFENARVYHSAVEGSFAYVAAGAYGMAVLNVSTPSAPIELGRFDSAGSARFVVLRSPYAYLADEGGGLQILDVSNPVSPSQVAALGTTGNAVAVAVSGPLAYVAAGSEGLRIIDISNPAGPVEVGFYDTPGTAQGVEVWGSVAIVSDGTAGVHLLDVSNPTAPSLVATLDTPGVAREAHLVGDSLYIADVFGFLIEDLTTCFSAPPSAFSLISPPPGSPATACELTLDWENAVGAYRYDLYLDTVDPPTALAASDLTESQWWATGLPPLTPYYWRVEAKNALGATSSSIGSFTTAPIPGPFGLALPAADAQDVGTSAMLSWNPSAGAQSYSLYLGTDEAPPLYASDLSGTSYAMAGLSPDTTYHWYVVAHSPCDTTPSTGGPFAFTTACASMMGRWPSKSYGSLRSTVTHGTYAYAGNGLVLTVLDLSNPSSPSVLREIDLPSEVDEGEMLVSGGYLYVPQAGQPDGLALLQIYSLADPTDPSEVGRVSLGNPRGGMELAGNLLYVADGTGGLKVIDVANPTAPWIVGSFPAPPFVGRDNETRDVTVYTVGPTTYAYVAHGYTGVQVLDMTNPASPAVLATLPMAPDGWTESVGRTGNTLVVGEGGGGVTLYDLSTPSAPTFITTWLPPESSFYVEWVTLDGDTAYVCDSILGLFILDLSDAASPGLLGSRPPWGMPFHLALSGSTALLAEDFGGLSVLDVSDPASIARLGGWDASERVSTGIWSDATRAFTIRSGEGLGILDVSVPSSPSELGIWDLQRSNLQGVTVRGNLAFVADRSSGLYIVDATNPAAPVQIGAYDRGGWNSALSDDGGTLYYATGGGGMWIFNVSTPSSPTLLGQWSHPIPCVDCSGRSVALDGSYAYLADAAGGLRVLDVSTPATPVLVASASTAGPAVDVRVAEGHVYVLSKSALDVFDVSDPSSPALLTSLALPDNWGRLDLSGSVAAVGAGATGALVLDLSDPSAPAVLRTVDTPGLACEARIVENRLHVADYFGVVIEDLASCCSGPPAPPALLSPADGASGVFTSLKLDWSDPQWVLRYDLFLDTDNPPATLVSTGIPVSSQIRTLLPGTTYYWKVVAHGPCAETESGVYSFTTAPHDLAVTTLSDSPDPVLASQQITYTLSIVNDCPYSTSGVVVTEALAPSGGATVTFDAGASDPRWSWDSGTMTLTADLGTLSPGAGDSLAAAFVTQGVGTVASHATVAGTEPEPDSSDNVADVVTQVAPLALGDRVWRDDDADGVQDPGEPGLAGVVVKLYNDSNQMLQEVVTDPSGAYQLRDLTYGAQYFVKFFLPSSDFVFSPRDQGTDDTADSDADTLTGQTSVVVLQEGLDPSRWDCGMIPGALCVPPDEPVYISGVTLTTDGNDYPVLTFMNPNQPSQTTGFNVYRTHDPARPHDEWPQVASDVVDMDEATPNNQWVDTSGEDPPPEYTVWYYEVAAYNHHCGTGGEGPW